MLAAGCSCGSNSNTPLSVEKANIVVDAFPAIDSAGLYIAQMDDLFADQGLHVTIEPSQATQTTQTEINGQLNGPAAAWRSRARPGRPAPVEVPGQFLAGRAGAKKSVSSWLTRSCSS